MVVRDALGRYFPPHDLVLECLVHLAPRILKGMYKATAHALYPQRPLLAGVRGAGDLARCVLYSVLHAVHAAFLREYGLTAATHPFVRLNLNSWERPFS